MGVITGLSALLAAAALGLTAGALLAEGAILVVFWRSLPPASFLGWYKEHAALLQRFFGALEVAAAALTMLAAALSWVATDVSRHLLGVSALLSVAVLAVFPLYFQRVNAGFAAGTIAAEHVAGELRRWRSWHWIRTVIATGAFLFAMVALMTSGTTPAA